MKNLLTILVVAISAAALASTSTAKAHHVKAKTHQSGNCSVCCGPSHASHAMAKHAMSKTADVCPICGTNCGM